MMPTAIEEFLRAYSPVTMAREVVKDVTINGCPMKPGAMVLLSFPAANRDPEMFPDADKVLLDRQENRHAAFGLGIHRCVGDRLADLQLNVVQRKFLWASAWACAFDMVVCTIIAFRISLRSIGFGTDGH